MRPTWSRKTGFPTLVVLLIDSDYGDVIDDTMFVPANTRLDVMLGKPHCQHCGPLDRHGTHGRKVRKHGLVYLIWMLMSMFAAGLVNVVKFCLLRNACGIFSRSANACMQP